MDLGLIRYVIAMENILVTKQTSRNRRNMSKFQKQPVGCFPVTFLPYLAPIGPNAREVDLMQVTGPPYSKGLTTLQQLFYYIRPPLAQMLEKWTQCKSLVLQVARGQLLCSNYELDPASIGQNARGPNDSNWSSIYRCRWGWAASQQLFILHPAPIGLDARGDEPYVSQWAWAVGIQNSILDIIQPCLGHFLAILNIFNFFEHFPMTFSTKKFQTNSIPFMPKIQHQPIWTHSGKKIRHIQHAQDDQHSCMCVN